MSKVQITDLTLRDAHQCLLATRMRTEDMLPICAQLDKVGFWSLEVWGGATYDSCLRFLKEDPWDRLRALKNALPNTPLMMLLRGQNLVGYRHYPDDIVAEFVALAAQNGVDVFRIFDALNDLRNLETAINCVKKHNKHAQGAIAYTISPIHTRAQFVSQAKTLEAMGCDSIAIKDMAGLLTPVVTAELVGELLTTLTVPLHLHSHSTSGLASICHYVAIQQGCRHIDTVLSSFAGGASHPCTESMVSYCQETDFDTGYDLSLLADCGEYFRQVRKKYHQFESDATGIDPRVQLYQVPGGMISNLYSQLKSQNALDKLPEVQKEIPKVRADLGYPPLVTPSSQIVGTQAVLNVMTGKRYESMTNEVKWYCQGKYGKPPGTIKTSVLNKAIGQTPVMTQRPADELAAELPKLRKQYKTLAKSPEDLMSLALFPEIAKTFINEREVGQLVAEPLEPIGKDKPLASEFNITLHGEAFHVKVVGQDNSSPSQQTYYFMLDGVPEEVLVKNLARTDAPAQANTSTPTEPGDVSVTMPSTIIDILVSEGQTVVADEPVLIAEAMKMETQVKAPIAGDVKAIYCKLGQQVAPDTVLIKIVP